MPGYGSAGKFYFLSLLVKDLGLWIGCAFCGIHKVHRANKVLCGVVSADSATPLFVHLCSGSMSPPTYVAVSNMIRFLCCKPTRFFNSEPDLNRSGFRKKCYPIRCRYPNCVYHCSQIF